MKSPSTTDWAFALMPQGFVWSQGVAQSVKSVIALFTYARASDFLNQNRVIALFRGCRDGDAESLTSLISLISLAQKKDIPGYLYACHCVPSPPFPIQKGFRPRCGRAPSTFSAPRNQNFTHGGRSLAGHYKRPDAPPSLTAAWRKEAFIAEGVS